MLRTNKIIFFIKWFIIIILIKIHILFRSPLSFTQQMFSNFFSIFFKLLMELQQNKNDCSKCCVCVCDVMLKVFGSKSITK